MKIGFVGPANSGKTTTARIVSERLGLPLITEVARSVIPRIADGMSLDDIRKSPKLYCYVQSMILVEQLKREHSLDEFVSDRTLFDIYVYTKLFVPECKKVMSLFGDMNSVKSRYDLLVYCEPVQREDDGFRSFSQYEREVKEFEKIKQYADVILPPISIDERVKIVIEAVEKQLK